uniref:PHD-type domain-containing protein n=1 Tax=Glossina brevipalpis TaxID=37001 RepID=A0A1A9WL13_9MUSC
MENRCSICNQNSSIEGDDILIFGEWITSKDLTIHYYCLLLSTNLPQNGNDASGILGFLFRDIRREIAVATKRKCKYCLKANATIGCKTCNEYFHLTCGYLNECLFQFGGEFNSYCHICLPLDDYQKQLVKTKRLNDHTVCYICAKRMSNYNPRDWIYATCCQRGFVHNFCMQRYALNAGYYLKCIWCKSMQFRDAVKFQGIFVPDRDAKWELEPDAYKELHCGYNRCDMKKCNSPRGREYTKGRKWFLSLCQLCGSFAVHNPSCIPGFENSKERVEDFKCDTCLEIERDIDLRSSKEKSYNELFDATLYVRKTQDRRRSLLHESMEFSEDSMSSMITVIPSQNNNGENDPPVVPDTMDLNENTAECIQAQLYDECDNENVDENNDKIQKDEEFLILNLYEFNKAHDCLAEVKVKLNPNDPRFAGKTVDEIKRSNNLVTAEDVIERISNPSILKEFDEIINNTMQ